jgi:hypothetical protein
MYNTEYMEIVYSFYTIFKGIVTRKIVSICSVQYNFLFLNMFSSQVVESMIQSPGILIMGMWSPWMQRYRGEIYKVFWRKLPISLLSDLIIFTYL